MIDINNPVKEGSDVVLNNPDGTQDLGSPQEFLDRAEAGTLRGVHTEKVNKETEMADETKLSDEQTNGSAEERTEGEVAQTEEVRETESNQQAADSQAAEDEAKESDNADDPRAEQSETESVTSQEPAAQ